MWQREHNKLFIFNWDERAEHVVRELHADIALPDLPIVVVTQEAVDTAGYQQDPAFQGVTWLAADYFDPDTLAQIEAPNAGHALVLADRKNTTDPDGSVALIVLALRKACAKMEEKRRKVRARRAGSPASHTTGNERGAHHLRIVAETVNHRKIPLVQQAGADEVICSSAYGLSVVAQTLITPGLAKVYDDLLTFSEDTNEVYCLRVEPPGGSVGKGRGEVYEVDRAAWETFFAGKSFRAASKALLEARGKGEIPPVVLIGVRRLCDAGDGSAAGASGGSAWQVFLNPPDVEEGLAAASSDTNEGGQEELADAGAGSAKSQHATFDRFKEGDQPIVIGFSRPQLHLGRQGDRRADPGA